MARVQILAVMAYHGDLNADIMTMSIIRNLAAGNLLLHRLCQRGIADASTAVKNVVDWTTPLSKGKLVLLAVFPQHLQQFLDWLICFLSRDQTCIRACYFLQFS